MAKPNNTEAKVLPILEPIIAEKGLELVDLEFVKEGVNWYLRVYIDKDGGVNIDDCEAVSRALEVKLDEKDPIEQAYILEVSSPGIDRPLKKDADFVKYQGEIIDVKLYKAQDGSKRSAFDIVADEVEFLSANQSSGAPSGDYHQAPAAPAAPRAQAPAYAPADAGFTQVDDDELPF